MQTIPKPRSEANALSAPLNQSYLIQGSTGQGKIVTANLKAPIIVLDATNDYINFSLDAVFIIHANTLKESTKRKKVKKQKNTRG